MPRPLRTDVATRVLIAWIGVSVLGCIVFSPTLIFWTIFSLPFAMIAILLALWFGDNVVRHQRRWALAAIVVPLLATSLVFGRGALFSLFLSVPVTSAFLIMNRKWPLPPVLA
jgi:predicted branched-subunit amino acid permease